jgi:Protein of unknown function (DUF2846)
MIKIMFLVILLVVTISLPTSSAFAQEKPTDGAGAPGCGEPKTKFEVKTNKSQHLTQADAGKALVYFIENDSQFDSFPSPTTRMGIDGEWVGATHGNSYFYLSVDPGVHHLCASWQKAVLALQGRQTAAAHFTAEAGGVYYFEVKNVWHRDHGAGDISLRPLDSDEGQLLANKISFSTFQPKK